VSSAGEVRPPIQELGAATAWAPYGFAICATVRRFLSRFYFDDGTDREASDRGRGAVTRRQGFDEHSTIFRNLPNEFGAILSGATGRCLDERNRFGRRPFMRSIGPGRIREGSRTAAAGAGESNSYLVDVAEAFRPRPRSLFQGSRRGKAESSWVPCNRISTQEGGGGRGRLDVPGSGIGRGWRCLGG